MSPCLVRILMQKVELAGRQRARKHRHPLHRGRYSRSLAGRKVLRSLWSTFRHWYWCGCLYRWSNRFDCRRKCSHALCGSSHMRPWMWSRCKQYAIVSVRDLPSKKTRKIHELVERDGRPWICAHRLGLLFIQLCSRTGFLEVDLCVPICRVDCPHSCGLYFAKFSKMAWSEGPRR